MVFPGNILGPILILHILCSNHILLADFPPSLPQRLFWNIWYAPCIFGTTVQPGWGRSDRVLVLRACRNCGGSINYFKSFTLWPQSWLTYFPSAFNSSAVLPPCLRRRSAILGSSPSMAQSSGVLLLNTPPSTFAFTSAPLAISSSAISL